MSKHTVHPWHVAANTNAQGDLMIVANEAFSPRIIATVHQDEDDEPGAVAANAYLMAAGPELLVVPRS